MGFDSLLAHAVTEFGRFDLTKITSEPASISDKRG